MYEKHDDPENEPSSSGTESQHANANSGIGMSKRKVGDDSTNGPTAKKICDNNEMDAIFKIMRNRSRSEKSYDERLERAFREFQKKNNTLEKIIAKKDDMEKILKQKISRLEKEKDASNEAKKSLDTKIAELEKANCDIKQTFDEEKKKLTRDIDQSKKANRKENEEKESLQKCNARLKEEKKKSDKALEKKISDLKKAEEQIQSLKLNKTKKTCAFCQNVLDQFVFCSNVCTVYLLNYHFEYLSYCSII